MSIEKNRLNDDELEAVSGGYIVNQHGKYYVVDSKGRIISIGGEEQEGFDKLSDARLMAIINKQSLTEISLEQWDALKRRNK